ncbi:unnamed protein product, partial [Mesorhabditis belari]|uniref:Tyrosine-protein kinase n=1 Tax=Mesorhabditis belari TaxID=2138241 RepID=A0AAF3J2Q4_9BILA
MDGSLVTEEIRILPFYHGLLPREDISDLLRREGQFLLRISETKEDEGEKTLVISFRRALDPTINRQSIEDKVKSGRSGSGKRSTRRTITSGTKKVDREKEKMEADKRLIKHAIVHLVNNRYTIDQKESFETLLKLIEYHSRRDAVINERGKQISCRLEYPVIRQSWEYEHSDIQLEKKLGNGEFGEVWKGKIRRRQDGKWVNGAIKLSKGENAASKKKRKEVMLEIRMMRDLKHPNVVHAYGVAVLQNPIYILIELVSGGDLQKFLKNKGRNQKSKEKRLLVFHAACGIEYIHANGIIHRDLAARNCLYDGRRLRISDFGLSVKGPTYEIPSGGNQRLPIRWLSPEVLTEGKFSFESDVWAFGCLVCEIYANGEAPYDGKTNSEVKEILLDNGKPGLAVGMWKKLATFLNDGIFLPERDRASMRGVVDFLSLAIDIPRPDELHSDDETRTIASIAATTTTTTTSTAPSEAGTINSSGHALLIPLNLG